MRILYYLPEDKEGQKTSFQGLFEGMGAEALYLPSEGLDTPLGEILSRKAYRPRKDARRPPMAALVMEGFEDADISTLFGILKEAEATGLAPFPLKAVVTENNLLWSVQFLFLHLARERRILARLRRLYQAKTRLEARKTDDPKVAAFLETLAPLLMDPEAVEDEAALDALLEEAERLLS